MSDIENFDRPWTRDKIQILVEGAAPVTMTDATGRKYDTMVEGMTLYEMRCKALDGGNPDMIVESAQFDNAVRQIPDENVRSVLLLVTHAKADPDHVASLIGDSRRGYNMLKRGQDLILREQRRRARSRRRRRGRGKKIVCWRCMTAQVDSAGAECEPTCVKTWRDGPPRKYDVASAPDVSTMTEQEKLDEIMLIAKGQSDTVRRNEPIPGQKHYDDMTVPYGSSPDEITEHGESWRPI